MKMKVTGGSLNVRRKPNLTAEIAHILADGEIVTVGPEKDGWRSFGSGYVMAKFLTAVDEGEPDPVPEDANKDVVSEIKAAAKEVKKAAKTTKTTARKTTKKTADK